MAGAGDDIIVGDQTDTLLDGGAHSTEDILRISAAFNDFDNAQIINIEEVQIMASGLTVSMEAQTEALVIVGAGGGSNTIVGGLGNDTISGASGRADSITAGLGDDRILGADSNDTINAGDGTDTLVLESNYAPALDTDLVGIEIIEVTSDTRSTIDLISQASDAFTVTLTGANGHVLVLKSGANSVIGSAGADSVTGGDANDTLSGGDGNDVLNGFDGLDSLIGGTGDDTIDGGKDNDTIIGGAGADRLIGGLGSDDFIFTSTDGTDAILDFNAGFDRIVFDISELGLNAADYTAASSSLIDVATAQSLAAGAAANDVLFGSAASIAAFTDSNNAFAGGVLAITTDTGRVLYDADGDFTSGSMELATFTSSQAPFLSVANVIFIA
jgi:Ca2+-binding RTX toxin-like protein